MGQFTTFRRSGALHRVELELSWSTTVLSKREQTFSSVREGKTATREFGFVFENEGQVSPLGGHDDPFVVEPYDAVGPGVWLHGLGDRVPYSRLPFGGQVSHQSSD